MRLKTKITQYLELIRWQAFSTFAQMVAGFFVAKRAINVESALVLAQYFVVLGPLLYGGLYIFNNIVDYPQDVHGKTKKKRPLVSGEISLNTAWLLLLIHAAAVLISLLLLNLPSLLCQLVLFFLALNVSYTLAAKKIPYLDLIGCSLGHPARTAAGILLAADPLIKFWPLLTVNLLTITALNILKRLKERELDGIASRPVLKFYQRKTLLILAAFLISASITLLPFATEDMWELIFAAALTLGTIISYVIYLYAGRRLRGALLKVWR